MTAGFVSLSGVDYASTPDAAALDITGDFEAIAYVALTDWTPAAENGIAGKYLTATPDRSWRWQVNIAGGIGFTWTENGSTQKTFSSSKTLGEVTDITGGTGYWLRVTLDVDDGSSGHEVKFYWSADSPSTAEGSVSWTQLGITRVGVGVTSIHSGTSQVEIGSEFNGGSNPLTGDVYRLILKSGIDGTVALDANFTNLSAAEVAAKAFTEDSANAATVTINGVGWTYTYAVDGSPSLMLMGVG